MRSTLHKGTPLMALAFLAQPLFRSSAGLLLLLSMLGWVCERAIAQESSAVPTRLTLDQAIDLALKQNRSIRLRSLSIEQTQSQKDQARSNYRPQIKASGNVLHLTELSGIKIPAGAFGNFPSTGEVPSKSLTIDQGAATGYTGGVGLEQPLTQLFRIHQANIAAKQDVLVAKTQYEQTEDEIALQVRKLYYDILISQQKEQASQDQLAAAQLKDEESRRDVERGNALEISTLQAKAGILQAQQDSLTFRLQEDDLRRQLADALGLPVNTPISLDPAAAAATLDIPSRTDAVRTALDQNHELRAARQTLKKAQAGLAAAQDDYIPDITALSRYSYQSGIPFLVHNFGTFGFSVSYDLFDGGRREAKVREARSEVRSAEVAVEKAQSEIEVQVQSIYDRIDELKQMVPLAEQNVTVRTEAARLADRQFEQNAALNSTRSQDRADLANATASLLEIRCNLSLAEADLKTALGQMPK